MKLKLINFPNALITSNLFLMPLFTYLTGKFLVRTEYKNEQIWWITLPILFIFWFILNVKIKLK